MAGDEKHTRELIAEADRDIKLWGEEGYGRNGIVRRLRDALQAAENREAARKRDAAHPEYVPEAVTDAAFESQANWWRPGDEPLQGVLVPQLIEQVAEAAYRGTLEALLPGDDDWEWGIRVEDGFTYPTASRREAIHDASLWARVRQLDGTVKRYKKRVVRRRLAGPWEPVEEVPRG